MRSFSSLLAQEQQKRENQTHPAFESTATANIGSDLQEHEPSLASVEMVVVEHIRKRQEGHEGRILCLRLGFNNLRIWGVQRFGILAAEKLEDESWSW